jgi:hypothetical protein
MCKLELGLAGLLGEGQASAGKRKSRFEASIAGSQDSAYGNRGFDCAPGDLYLRGRAEIGVLSDLAQSEDRHAKRP